MLSIRTVLCPVDFSPATTRQVDLAADLCRAFGAKLVLHHNLTQLSTGAAVGWMWAADHAVSDKTAEQRMRDLVARVPDGVEADAHITHGIALPSVLALSEAIEADLLVLTCHGMADDDHPSVTERVIDDSDRSVLVLHEAANDDETPSFASGEGPAQVVLVPTDLTEESAQAVKVAFELARKLPVELHLLHVERAGGRPDDPSKTLQALTTLVPDDLTSRVRLHIEHGDAAGIIAAAAVRLNANCIVMGEHARRPLRRWFSRDTSKAVLHKAHCPVWYVPGDRRAIATHHTLAAEDTASS